MDPKSLGGNWPFFTGPARRPKNFFVYRISWWREVVALDKEKKQSKRGQKRVVAKAKARGRGGSIQLSHKMFTAPLSFPPTHSHFKASGSNCGGERRRRSNLDFFSYNKQRAPEVSAKKRGPFSIPLPFWHIYIHFSPFQPTPVRYSFDIAAAVSSDRFGTGQLNSENETAAAAAATCGQQANDEERKRCCRFRLRGGGETKMKGEICYH